MKLTMPTSRVPRVCTQTRAYCAPEPHCTPSRFDHSSFDHSVIDSSFEFRHSNFRRGSTFIITAWILTALTGLTLAIAHAVRVETAAAADKVALAQSIAAEKGAEQFVLSAVDAELATPGTIHSDEMLDLMAGMQIGNAYVYILKPDPEDESAIAFGLTDEAAKVDLNTASAARLLMLPNMTQDLVDSIIDWRDADDTPGSMGAESGTYAGLPTPYRCKNANFETVEELLLVNGFDTDILFGTDGLRAGRAFSTNTAENAPPPDPASALLGTTLGTSTSDRGIAPFITVYGVKASTTPPATTTTGLTGGTTTTTANVNNPNAAFQKILQDNLATGRSTQILTTMDTLPAPLRVTSGAQTIYSFQSVFHWAAAVNLTSAEYALVYNQLTATLLAYVQPVAGGFIISATPISPPIAKTNVNTAPEQVLMCLPNLDQADAQSILATRPTDLSVDPGNIGWLLDAITSRDKKIAIGPYVTGTSVCYSADILAASTDGRSFKRTRIVVDASSGTAKIIYRRDMTQFGWPLTPEYRASLRKNRGPIPFDSNNGAVLP
jgi:DNA uptake protein ComE-like DNA-binding protein